MKRTLLLISTAVFSLCLVSACVTSSDKLIDIQLGMTKGQVRQELGDPTVARGAIRNKFGQVIEVWEYRLALPSSDTPGQVIGKSMLTVLTLGVGAAAFKGERRNYWVYFLGDQLVQWGEAGDWSREPDRIYQFNFEPHPTAPR